MVYEIKKFGAPVLRKKAEPITEITPELTQLANDMLETMYDAPGVGLAAPQIGKSLRLIVLDVSPQDAPNDPYIVFNPEISIQDDAKMTLMEEGCLSVPDLYGEVERPDKIIVTGLDENGENLEIKVDDYYLSHAFQHEIDHLNGVVFVDKLKPTTKAMMQSKLKKMARQNKNN